MNFKLRIDYCACVLMLIFVVIVEANYWLLLQTFKLSVLTVDIIWAVLLILPVIIAHGKLKFTPVMGVWAIYLFIVLIRNQEFFHMAYMNTLRIVLCVVTVFVCAAKAEWTKSVPLMMFIIGVPNVIATLLFFVNKNLYYLFISKTYKEFQSGTYGGQFGYRAGIAGHYSHNGTYIAMVFIVLGVMLCCLGLKRQKLIITVALTVFTGVALFLTSKRAHILFGAAAILILYYVANRSNKTNKFLRIIIFGVITAVGLALFLELMPNASFTIERFQAAGEDGASKYRILMWKHAMNGFFKSPIFGSGWYGFSYDPNIAWVPGASSGCHNIYIQLLFDTGIAGFTVTVGAIIWSLVTTVKNLLLIKKSDADNNYFLTQSMSFAIQVFYVLYGMTGNMLFDQMFMFYAIAIAVSMATNANISSIINPVYKIENGKKVQA